MFLSVKNSCKTADENWFLSEFSIKIRLDSNHAESFRIEFIKSRITFYFDLF